MQTNKDKAFRCYHWALSFEPKIPKISKRDKWLGNSEKRTIQPKIPEIPAGKSNGTEILDKKFPKISVYLATLPTFLTVTKNTVKFAMEISRIANRNFWLNGKRPLSLRLAFKSLTSKVFFILQ